MMMYGVATGKPSTVESRDVTPLPSMENLAIREPPGVMYMSAEYVTAVYQSKRFQTTFDRSIRASRCHSTPPDARP